MTQTIVTGQISTLQIRQEGQRVVVISNGKAILDLPWDAALAVAQAIRTKALLAEEQAKAEAIVFDQALLARLGVPFGLTGNKAIQQEARKEAAWNSDLRRYIRHNRMGDMGSQAVVGAPAIIRRDPPGKE